MNIRWTEEATTSLEQISLYIAEDNVEAAFKTINSIYGRIEQLSSLPSRGRPGREQGTRELALSPMPYIVTYRIRESTVEILQIWHGAQDR
jgi:plasmid stabilization system protein ParE